MFESDDGFLGAKDGSAGWAGVTEAKAPEDADELDDVGPCCCCCNELIETDC